MNWSRMFAITKTDLLKLKKSRDFWIPMLIMASLFFVILPTILLYSITLVQRIQTVQDIGTTLAPLQQAGGEAGKPITYNLAVSLFAALAVVVPMTICSAIGANTLVGERERGTGEFLAHSPASEREIYFGKLIASLLPGYFATVVGFGIYSLVVNTIVGPDVGGWFFPTGDWWILMFWVVPPFLALALSVILRVSGRVRSAAAAQQASGLVTLPLIIITYGQSSGSAFGEAGGALVIGAVAWILAFAGLWRGSRAVSRPRLMGIDL
ncbi:MAG: ABC transporter permease subunit [Actinomycetota bacterium]